MIDNVQSLAAAIPAATLVIFREAPNGPPELLMVERARAMAFAGGAMVFPGGRLDPGDHALAELEVAAIIGADRDEIAARIAAIRETIEEAGLAIGLSPTPPPPTIEQLRRALHAATPFGAALDEAGAALDLSALVPFARWRPTHLTTRIFDTRFYLARLPTGSAPATVDETENVRLVWTTAAAILAQADAGEVTIIYPTRRNLERLAQFGSFDDAAADADRYPVEVITPAIEQRDGAAHLCIPAGLGYPVTSEAVASAKRG